MFFIDAPPQKTLLQNDTFLTFGPPIILFGGFACFIWALGQYMWRTAEEGTKTIPAIVKTVPAVQLPFVGAGVAPLDNRPLSNAEDGPGIISIMPQPGKKRKVVGEWTMRGVIYDLITLKPIPGAHMIFTDNVTNSRAQIQIDARGRYRVTLPSLTGRGYLVTLSKTGYLKSYLNLQPHSYTPLVTDFHMAPK